jgi:Na+-driven multidrug efflux pump
MGKPKEASDTLKQTFYVTILLGLSLSLFAGLLAPNILKFMGAERDVIAVGTPYFQVVGLWHDIQLDSYGVGRPPSEARRQTRQPMVVNLVAIVVNVCGNAVLIWGLFGFPEWGFSEQARHYVLAPLCPRFGFS